MSKLQPQQLARISRILEDRQKLLEEDVRNERNNQAEDNYMQIASEVADPGDSSFAHLSVDLGNASVTRDVNELNAIQRAQSRIEDGTYGECLECGYQIPLERLEAQPIAERCAPCQNIYEKTHADARKGATL
jgi:RNA polymerase-binding protein DksA